MGKGKKKRYTKEKRTDNTLTTKDHYVIFPQIPRSNQFCPSPKNNRPVPRSVSRRYSRREHRRVQISGTCRIRSQSRSCRARPRIVEGKKKRKEEEREEESWWLLRARASSPTSPFLRFTFSTSLDVFPHPFSYPSLTFTFFCYRLHEPFEMLLQTQEEEGRNQRRYG